MQAAPISTSVKSATAVPNRTPVQQEAAKREHAALIANAIAMSFGLGGLSSAGSHMWGLMNRQRLPRDVAKMSPTAPLMSRRFMPKPDEDKDKDGVPKLAAADAPAAPDDWAGHNIISRLAGKPLYDMVMKRPRTATGGWADASTLRGDNAPAALNNPWVLGLGIPGSLLSFYAGNRAVDAVGEGLRKREREDEQKRMRARYEELLKVSADESWEKLANTNQRTLPGVAGEAVADALGTALGSTVGPVVQGAGKALGGGSKSLFEQFMEHPYAGTAIGAGGAWAALSSLMAGKLTYDSFKDRKRQSVLDSAVKRREEERRKQHLPASRVILPGEESLYA